MSDTPETDAQIAGSAYQPDYWKNRYVPTDFARKLERERNEARAELQTQLNNIRQYDYHYGLHVAERDQLRKVADELAKSADDFLSIRNESKGVTGWHLNGEILTWEECESVGDLEAALNNYNSLPHVIERSKAK